MYIQVVTYNQGEGNTKGDRDMGNYTEYKGYYIESNFYGEGEYSVQYDGDDIIFQSEAEAKAFIDEIA